MDNKIQTKLEIFGREDNWFEFKENMLLQISLDGLSSIFVSDLNGYQALPPVPTKAVEKYNRIITNTENYFVTNQQDLVELELLDKDEQMEYDLWNKKTATWINNCSKIYNLIKRSVNTQFGLKWRQNFQIRTQKTEILRGKCGNISTKLMVEKQKCEKKFQ